jgi:hypothetical protein
MIATPPAAPPPHPTSPPVQDPPIFILPAMEARIAACRLARERAHRMGDAIAGYMPSDPRGADRGDALPALALLLRGPRLTAADALIASSDGSVGWSGEGRFLGRPGAAPALLASAATILARATRDCDTLGALAAGCIHGLASRYDPRRQVEHLSEAFRGCDALAAGWGRWAAALAAAALAEEQWRLYGSGSRRDVSILLWQCGFDAQDAADTLVGRRYAGPDDDQGLDGADEARRHRAAWTTCAELLGELGRHLTTAVLTYLARATPPGPPPAHPGAPPASPASSSEPLTPPGSSAPPG